MMKKKKSLLTRMQADVIRSKHIKEKATIAELAAEYKVPEWYIDGILTNVILKSTGISFKNLIN